MSKDKGSRWERHYRNAFNAKRRADVDAVNRVGTMLEWVRAFYAIRIPTSGAGTTDDLPDLHVWFNGNGDRAVPHREVLQYAAEVKAGRDRVSLDAAEIAALRRYADATGSIPIVIVHIDYTGDYVFRLDDLHKTDSGNYTVTKKRDVDDADTFDDFVQTPYRPSRR